MAIRRWATYSVRDHNHPDAFVADVLLYDRLVVPVPPNDEKDPEYQRWASEGWAPGRLHSMLGRIGDLVEQVPWSEHMRKRFADHWQTAKTVGRDPFASTREFLRSEVPAGDRVRPVVAFDSEDAFRADVQAQPGSDVQNAVDQLAIAFRHEFLVPDVTMNHVDRLERAAHLARSPEFRKARTRFYEWQETIIARGYTVGQAVAEMEAILAEYEAAMKEAKWEKSARYAIFVAGVAFPAMSQMHFIAEEVAARFDIGLKVVDFARGESESRDTPYLAPAAMLHTSIKELGLRGPASKGASGS